jgi:type I restriction enzyme S subunit
VTKHQEKDSIQTSWQLSPLVDVAELIMGQSPPSSTYNDNGNGLPFYQGKADFGFVYPHIRLFCSAPQKMAIEKDILMSVRAPVGAVNLCKQKSCIGRGLAAIRSKDIDFMFLYFQLLYLEKKIASLGSGSTFKSINKHQLGNVLLVKPLPTEQQNIAHILSKIQSAIEAQEKIIQTTTELKKALMQKLFTEGLKGEPQKETEIGKVPKNWEIKKLGDYATLITKGASPKWQGFNYCENGVMFIRSQNIGWGDVIKTGSTYLPETFNKTQKRSILKADDVLVNLVGASIGRVAVAPREFEGANINQAVALVRIKKKSYLPKFIMYFLLTDMGQFLIKRQVKAIARGNISLEDVSNFFVPMPTISEQEEIVNTLTIIDEKHKFVIAKKQILINLFSSMLHHLMTGQIRIKDLRVS